MSKKVSDFVLQYLDLQLVLIKFWGMALKDNVVDKVEFAIS